MIVALLLSAIVFAQPKSVTKFLGIPVDGSKAEMIQKLKDKGYTYIIRNSIVWRVNSMGEMYKLVLLPITIKFIGLW